MPSDVKKVSVRSMVCAPKGKVLVAADLSQAESWIVMGLSGDRNMRYSLLYSDIHTDSGAALFDFDVPCTHVWIKQGDDFHCGLGCGVTVVKTKRYIGKRYNHASAYRMKPPRAAQVINKDSDKPPFVLVTIAESKVFSERWHARYNLKIWWSEIEEQLNRNRKLTTPYGRSRVFFAQWGEELFREATAYVPQSTVADHFNGMVQAELGIPGGLRSIRSKLVAPYASRKIINQSHDSCIIECAKEDGRDLCLEMQAMLKRPLVVKGETFTIPVDGEMGERWGEMEKCSTTNHL